MCLYLTHDRTEANLHSPAVAVIGRQLLRHLCAACSLNTELQAIKRTAVVFYSETQNIGPTFVRERAPATSRAAMETAPDPRIVAICLLFCEEQTHYIYFQGNRDS